MTTQEMIFDYLKVQGLVPEYDEDKDIRFKYQMRNFVVSNYPDDRQFLQIMMPFIFDVTAENRVAALEACNKINLSKKIVKAVVMGEGVFLMTEVLLDETPEPSVMVFPVCSTCWSVRSRVFTIRCARCNSGYFLPDARAAPKGAARASVFGERFPEPVSRPAAPVYGCRGEVDRGRSAKCSVRLPLSAEPSDFPSGLRFGTGVAIIIDNCIGITT